MTDTSETANDVGRWLRPRARVALLVAGILVGILWANLAGFTAYAIVFWPTHGILENTVACWLGGTAALSTILAAPRRFPVALAD